MRFGPGVHFNASDVREGGEEKERETERGRERCKSQRVVGGKREREIEW